MKAFLFLALITVALHADHHKIEIMLTVPRTVSTAFERSIMARGDHKVFHEPWGGCYLYYRGMNNFPPLPELLEAKNYDGIKSLFYSYAKEKPVFAKDMVWLMCDELIKDQAFLSDPDVTLTLLIRNPAQSIESFYLKINENEHVNTELAIQYTYMVMRYDELLRLAEKYHEVRGEWPLIIEAEELCVRPKETMISYCQYAGIDFKEEALSWEQKMPEEWVQVARWATDAAKSEGFFVPKRGSEKARFSSLPEECKPALEQLYQIQFPVYEKLKELSKN